MLTEDHPALWIDGVDDCTDHSETTVHRVGSAGGIQYKLRNDSNCRSVGDLYVCKTTVVAQGLEAMKLADPTPKFCARGEEHEEKHLIRPYGGNSGGLEYCEKCVNTMRFEAEANADVARARKARGE